MCTELNININPVCQFLFVLINGALKSNLRSLEYFGLKSKQLPRVGIYDADSNMKWLLPEGEISTERVRVFCQSFLKGELKVSNQSVMTRGHSVNKRSTLIWFRCGLYVLLPSQQFKERTCQVALGVYSREILEGTEFLSSVTFRNNNMYNILLLLFFFHLENL